MKSAKSTERRIRWRALRSIRGDTRPRILDFECAQQRSGTRPSIVCVRGAFAGGPRATSCIRRPVAAVVLRNDQRLPPHGGAEGGDRAGCLQFPGRWTGDIGAARRALPLSGARCPHPGGLSRHPGFPDQAAGRELRFDAGFGPLSEPQAAGVRRPFGPGPSGSRLTGAFENLVATIRSGRVHTWEHGTAALDHPCGWSSRGRWGR